MTTAPFDDAVFYDIANNLRLCAYHEVHTRTKLGAPSNSYVTVGVPSHDNCCDGQLTASIMRIYPSSLFPEEDYRKAPCGPAFVAVHIDIEIVRCAPMIDGQGHFPSIQEIDGSSRQVYIESQAVWRGVECCLSANADKWASTIREQAFITPEGGCVGSRLTVIVGLTNGCDCE